MSRNTISQCPHCKRIIQGQIIRLYDNETLGEEPIWEGCEECYKRQIEAIKKQHPNFDPKKDIYKRY